ncbi:MAG: hypothetical protein AVDCRST_MAG28-2335 [uncultured Rubrobacteraceae bacterium]|uniref:Uncharacterized protein n=1 Tax=uncultured Rubrobacteraceae bacterium TaxID=349277 RepID=A0A6J4R2C8_9ACTN|nr:MAG: hypothetical protein AVDCRST_MAG28-2335 [uncultured Rubrobacteraceae bacterium]
MRVAAVVVGSIGALLGVFKGLYSILTWALMGLRPGGAGVLNSYTYVLWAANAVLVASCIVALVGALWTSRGSQRMGGALFLAGVTGLAVAMVSFVVVQATVLAPQIPGMPTTPNTLFYVVWLLPVPFLLIAAGLSLFAGRGETRPAR